MKFEERLLSQNQQNVIDDANIFVVELMSCTANPSIHWLCADYIKHFVLGLYQSSIPSHVFKIPPIDIAERENNHLYRIQLRERQSIFIVIYSNHIVVNGKNVEVPCLFCCFSICSAHIDIFLVFFPVVKKVLIHLESGKKTKNIDLCLVEFPRSLHYELVPHGTRHKR